jgi:hypothetical protein
MECLAVAQSRLALSGEIWGDERYESGPLILLTLALEHRQYLVVTFKDLADCGQSLCPAII